jgi:hypothetical protein
MIIQEYSTFHLSKRLSARSCWLLGMSFRRLDEFAAHFRSWKLLPFIKTIRLVSRLTQLVNIMIAEERIINVTGNRCPSSIANYLRTHIARYEAGASPYITYEVGNAAAKIQGSPKNTLEVSIHRFYQNLAEYFCDVRNIHIKSLTPSDDYGRAKTTDLAVVSVRPTNDR